MNHLTPTLPEPTMESENPFAPSMLQPEQQMAADPDVFTVVDGRYILCYKRVSLPPVCVVTGKRDDLIPISESLSFRWYRVIVRQHWVLCHCFLHRSIHRRRSRIQRTSLLLRGLGFCLFFLPLGQDALGFELPNAAITCLIGIALFILGSLLVLLFASSSLRIASVIDRRQYLLTGFNPAFFAAIPKANWAPPESFSAS